MERNFQMQLGGRTLVVETGKYAEQAGGSCLVRMGDTAVLVCATIAKTARVGVDFLPLSVEFQEKLYAVGKIPGVGKVTQQKMQALGWHTVGALATAERAELVFHFGRWGHRLYDLARGHDERPVEAQHTRQQISTEITLPQDETLSRIGRHLPALAAELAAQMQRRHYHGSCVTLKLKNTDFQIRTRSQTFSTPLADAAALLQAAQQLLARISSHDTAYRLIGLGISHLSDQQRQAALWQESESAI